MICEYACKMKEELCVLADVNDGEMITSGMCSFGFGLQQHNTIYLQRTLAMLSLLKQY